MTDIRYSYHEDPEDKGRVVTVARALEGDNITFGFSVCQPTRWVTHSGEGLVVQQRVDGDRFVKKKGRVLARGRMEKRPFVIDRKGSTLHPLEEIRKFFATGQVSLLDPETGCEYPAPSFLVRAVVEGPTLGEAFPSSPAKTTLDRLSLPYPVRVGDTASGA